MAGLNEDQKWFLLQDAYDQAVAAGIPFCQYLKDQAKASMSGAGSVDGRRIISTSDGGQSVSYGDSESDLVPESEMSQFWALAARTCPECAGATDQETLACLQGSITADARYLVKSYRGLRGCGC
jgi:hypothetical protein